MTYPQNWQELNAARQLWAAPAEVEAAFDEIRATPIEYLFATRAFDILKPHVETLDNEGLAIVLGAAHRINAVQFDQRQAEALAFLIANAGRYMPPAPDVAGLPAEPGA